MKAASRPMIEVSGVSKFFGSFQALDDISFNVRDGEKVVIIGPSGSGKSTILRSINRLETIDRGKIIVGGMDLSNPEDRHLQGARRGRDGLPILQPVPPQKSAGESDPGPDGGPQAQPGRGRWNRHGTST